MTTQAPVPPNQDTQNTPQLQYSTGGGTIVTPQPSECAYPLRMDEFLTLCDGEDVSTSEQWRNLWLAVGLGALVGLFGLLATIDFGEAAAKKLWAPFAWTSVLALLVLLSLILVIFFHVSSRKARNFGAYIRLKQKIREVLTGNSAEAPKSTAPTSDLVFRAARYWANETWKDVHRELMARIKNGTLKVEVTNAELGPDPVPNVPKRLELSYVYRGKEYSKSVQENETLSIP